jgi:Fur family transcriptional regulator, ferric uptake regulator
VSTAPSTRLRAAFGDYAGRRGLKSTRQRDVIVDVFSRSGGHVTITELLDKVRKKDPRVGYATVYRTLRLLCEAGLADERHFGQGLARYERAGDHHHDHLICTSCGRVEEFANPAIEELQEEVARAYRFRIASHKHEIYGICARCQTER